MSTHQPFKILSIDGGGIKGLYSALILQHIEEAFCLPRGKSLSDYFDLICGTSTGGLIALGLSVKTPASQIANLYKEKGNNIFYNRNKKIAKIKQILLKGKYNNDNLKKELAVILGDKTMADAKSLLCIPAFNLTKGEPTVFKYPHPEGNFTRDGKIKMIDVALATSAAPTFFPIHEIDGLGRMIDGGIWANNPALCGVLEALSHFMNKDIISRQNETIKFNSIQLLSISSINAPIAQMMTGAKNKSFIDWKDKLFGPAFVGQEFFTDFYIKNTVHQINSESYYHRINSPILSAEQSISISMDNASSSAIKTIEALGRDRGYDYTASKRDLIKVFFESEKKYII